MACLLGRGPGWEFGRRRITVALAAAVCRRSGGRRGRGHGPPWHRSRVAGEDPGPMLPRLYCIRTQPAPDRGARDRGDDAGLDGGAGQVGGLPRSQRRVGLRRQFAGQRLDRDHDVRGKSSGAVLPEADRSSRPDPRRRSVCATWTPPAVVCPGARSRRCPDPRPRTARSGPARHRNTVTSVCVRGLRVLRARHRATSHATKGFVRGISLPSSREPCHDLACPRQSLAE